MNVETLAQAAVGRHGAGQDEWELDHVIALIGTRIHGRLVVEIGCDRGGTLWLWKTLGADVIGVTLHTRADGVFHPHGATVASLWAAGRALAAHRRPAEAAAGALAAAGDALQVEKRST